MKRQVPKQSRSFCRCYSMSTRQQIQKKKIQVLCEQTRELTHDFFRLCLMISGLGNFVVDCHI